MDTVEPEPYGSQQIRHWLKKHWKSELQKAQAPIPIPMPTLHPEVLWAQRSSDFEEEKVSTRLVEKPTRRVLGSTGQSDSHFIP